MAKGSVGHLNVLVGASIGGLRSGLKGGVKLVAGFAASVKGTLGGIGGLLAGVGLGVGLKSAAESMDSTAKAADRLGIGIEAFVGLQHAAVLSNVSVEDLNLGLTKMEDNLATAATKGGPVEKVLNDMGLSAKDLVNLKPDEAFGKIADGITSITNPSQRTAAAMDIFGKAGAGLIPLLKEGSVGFAKFREEAKRLGLSFSEVDAAKIDAADDAVTKLKASFKGAYNELAIAFAPSIARIAEGFAFGFADMRKTVGSFFGGAIKEIGFFVGTWELQWEVVKVRTAIAWNVITAATWASLDSIVAGVKSSFANFVPILKDEAAPFIAFWDANLAAARTFFVKISDVLRSVGQMFVATFAASWKAAQEFWSNPSEAVKGFFGTFAQEFATANTVALGAAADIGSSFSKEFSSSLKENMGGGFAAVLGDMAKQFEKTFSKNLDPALDAELKRLLDQLNDIRAAMPGADKAVVPAVKKGVGAFAGAGSKLGGGVSSQLAGATQIGTTEAASQITASMTAFNKKDDELVNLTKQQNATLQEIKNEISKNSVPDLGMIPAF